MGKSELILDVQHAPIVILPERREVGEGEDVLVDCKVTSNPRPAKVQWLKEGDRRFLQLGPTLRLNRASAGDGGRYVCSAANYVQPTGRPRVERRGNATIDIRVRHRPGEAFIAPERPTAVDGRSATLRCGADPPGHPAPKYRWWREDGSNGKTLAVGSEFTIDSVRLSSAGKYFCQPSNELGEGTVASAYLDVYQPPKVITSLHSEVTKRDGDRGFQLTCTASGKPRPQVRWFKDGHEVKEAESGMYQITTKEQETSSRAFNVLSVLKFVGPERINAEQLMPSDRGHYTCQFENEVSSAETKMLLRIQHAPVVVHQHNKVAFDLKDTAHIACRMQSFPEPSFDWSFKGSNLPNDHRYFEINRTALSGDVFQSTLTVFRVSEASYGDYTCRARNEIGPTKTKIRLQPRGKPENPVSVEPVAAGYNFVTLSWQEGFNGGYDETKFTVQYRRQGGGGGKPKYAECGFRNPCNLTGLEQHTQYYVRVMASNIKGESKWSPEAAVITKVDVALIPKPANVHYEKSTGKASFQVGESPLSLVAKVELENVDGTWSQYDGLSVHPESSFAELAVRESVVNNLRVRLCLESNELMCGPYGKALIVDVRPKARTSAALDSPWVIVVVVAVALLCLLVAVLLLRCFCCRRGGGRAGAKQLKDGNGNVGGRPTIVHSTQPPPSYNSNFGGVENKAADGLSSVKDVSDENLKAALFQNNGYHVGGVSGGGVGGPGDHQSNSNTNSANGGSVNSQDSLWNVKNGSPGVTATTILSNDPFTQQQQQQQQPQHHYQNGYIPFDTVAIQQQQQFQQQQQQQQQQQPSFEDYTHYPYPDEYLTENSRQYLTMGGGGDGQAKQHPGECEFGNLFADAFG